MKKVFFCSVNSYTEVDAINHASRKLLEHVVSQEKIELKSVVPLKVHFGAAGNQTFIGPQNFNGIIDFLLEKGIKSYFIETNVIYSGSRMLATSHQKLAQEHGFTRLPIIIADGEHGEDFEEVRIEKKHFTSCKIAREFRKFTQIIVISHFKGHVLAGFGGAIKQLAMGYASRGGKLAQHLSAKPFIVPFLCIRCGICLKNCPVKAIRFGMLPKIKHSICIGCAACIALCPRRAILINPLYVNLSDKFREKMAEYAYAAQLGQNNIYINYALNITSNCDCVGKSMKPIAPDIGIFASVDPVAIDVACMDILDKRQGKAVFTGRNIFQYAAAIGLGSTSYELVEI